MPELRHHFITTQYLDISSGDPYYLITFETPISDKEAQDFIRQWSLDPEENLYPERFTAENVDSKENGPQGYDYADRDKMCEGLSASDEFKAAGCTIIRVPYV